MDSGPRAGMQLFSGFSPLDNFFVRWSGYVLAPVTGTVTFQTISDDGCACKVNNVQIITDWAYHGPITTNGTIDLVQGQWYPIEVLFFEGGVTCEITLNWSYAGQAITLVPTTNLNTQPPAPAAPVLTISTPQNRTPVIDLSWNTVANAGSYEIWRGNQSGTETLYQTVNAPTTSYSDTNLFFQTTYFYFVRAINGPSFSANSNEVSGMPQPLPPRLTTVGAGKANRCGCASTGSPTPAALLLGLAALSVLFLRRRPA